MVAMNVWPTDGADGSVANEARWRKMGRHFHPTGVLPVGGQLKPTLAGTNLTVQDGAAWVDGAFCELLGAQVLTVTANGIAVVRFDPAANTAELLWRDGVTTPAQSPTGTFEMLVASCTGSVLTDRRIMSIGDHRLAFSGTTGQFNQSIDNAQVSVQFGAPFDPYGAYNISNGGWYPPRAGQVEVKGWAQMTLAGGATSTTQYIGTFYSNGVEAVRFGGLSGANSEVAMAGSAILTVNAAQPLQFALGFYNVPGITKVVRSSGFQIRYLD